MGIVHNNVGNCLENLPRSKKNLMFFFSTSVACRHRRQAADLPAKVAKRIGCGYKRGCSLEIGWSPIFVKILGHKFLVNFYVTFPCKTTYIALRTERSRDLSGKFHEWTTS